MVRPRTAQLGGPSSRHATVDGPRSFEAPREVGARSPISPEGGLRLLVPAGRVVGRETAVESSPSKSATGADLWWTDTGNKGDVAEASEILDERERARADRFHFERDRVRYVHRHAFLRRVLAGYLGLAPAEIVIRVAPGGRPGLEKRLEISFSMSSSGDVAVVAVTQGSRVGVDIERERQLDDALAVADGLFTESEARMVRSCRTEERSRMFLELWTRKEALVKAIGGGLSIPLDRYDVTDRIADRAWQPRGPAGPLDLAIIQFARPSGYVGSVAVWG